MGFAHISRLLTNPIHLPESANQRVRPSEDIACVRSSLAPTQEAVLSFGHKLGRHVRIDRNGDARKCGLSKPFRIHHFASVSTA